MYVDVQPLKDSPPDECFVLVEDRIQKHGGRAVLGWSIWEWPALFVEAEFHCVWEKPDTSLLDISPKKTPTARILFIPDAIRKYEGFQVNNVRKPLSKNEAVVQFLSASDAEYEFMNRGERRAQHGEIKVAGPDAQEYIGIQRAKAAAFLQMVKLKPNIGAYDPCPCGSGKKVKWCHRNGDAV